jgi:hypothetical protein
MRESERIRKIVEYYKKNLLKGYTEDSLRFSLVNQGYSRVTVDDALIIAHKELADKAPKLEEKPIIHHEIVDERNRPVQIKRKPMWKKVLGI